MSQNGEFCITNEELCIKNEELCIKNEKLCIQNDVFSATETLFSFNTAEGIYLWMYVAFSWWMTVLFDFVNHKKGSESK